jgi:hypothetical protein
MPLQASLPDEIMVSKWKDDTCALCEFVMTEVIQGLNDPSDQVNMFIYWSVPNHFFSFHS